ncbi:MAG TPA: cation transporter [Lachnospiraceae bacterium]|nr:cation transporter [Lachnospiraceae bacterium]
MKKENLIAKKLPPQEQEKIINRVSAVGIGGNILLSAFKLFAGIFGRSGAMISDAVHSLSDVFATVIAFAGVKMAEKKADTDHPYGHERFESIASMLLSLILAVTGLGIGYAGIQQILKIQSGSADIAVPGMIALAAAVISIVTKEAMFWYTRHCALKLGSRAFLADAWHHRSDALSSVGALVGIYGARRGIPVLDTLASLLICFFILKVALEIFFQALNGITDHSCSEEFEGRLRSCIREHPQVRSIDLLHTRKFGERVYVELEFSVKKDLSLEEAHDIAEYIHSKVERTFPEVKHITTHVNPC